MWPHLLNTLLGLWLMAAPAVLAYGDPARANDRITGPVVATFACIALWEVTRPLRWVCLAGGVWLLAAPWWLGYASQWQPTANSTGVGLLLIAFALIRGRRRRDYGGGWSSLWRPAGPRAAGG